MPTDDLDTIALNDLLARAQRGDSAARGDLIRRSQRRLEHLTRKMLRGFPTVHRWEDTADVLQNVLVRLVRALTSVTPTTTREYFGLAAEQIRRELLDLARHYQGPHGLARHHHSGAGEDPGDPPAAPDPSDHGADPAELERWARFHEAVEKLPAEEREVFVLTFYNGWSQARIAELFGVDERTVRRRWRAAAQLLHDALGTDVPDAEA